MSPDDIRQRAEYPGLKAMLPTKQRQLRRTHTPP